MWGWSMGLGSFVRDLRESRPVRISGPDGASDADLGEELAEMEAIARQHLPGPAPDWSPVWAEWAFRDLYLLTRALGRRGPNVLPSPLPLDEGTGRTPVIAWSVDLAFRHLPALAELADRGSSPGLRRALEERGRAWPLSSVGMSGLEPGSCTPDFAEHPTLLRLYVDRILARRDFSRAEPPSVRQGLGVALGDRRELCTELYDLLLNSETP